MAVLDIASTDRLGELMPEVLSCASEASGALYVGLAPRRRDCLLFLRKESAVSIAWAGNPNKAVTTGAHDCLHSRISFASWLEITRGRSEPWTEADRERASYMRG
jgi:light-regulated signal transduction histidine kinase (bacteriophytochrome)